MKTRVQLDLSSVELKELKRLEKLYGTKTRAEALRRAVREALNRSASNDSKALQKALEVIDKLTAALIKN